MIRLLFIFGLFFLILIPFWRLSRFFLKKIKIEFDEETPKEVLKNIKERRKALKFKINKQEKELKRSQKEHEKIKRRIVNGKF